MVATLPSGLTYSSIVGNILRIAADSTDAGTTPDGELLALAKIKLTPSRHPWAVHAAGTPKALLFIDPIELVCATDGAIVNARTRTSPTQVVATNDPTLGPFAYRVTVTAPSLAVPFEGYLLAPSGQTVDIVLTVPTSPVAPSLPEWLAVRDEVLAIRDSFEGQGASPEQIEAAVTAYLAANPVGVEWADVTGKPSSFAPSSHSHAQSDVTGLAAALAGKADAGHLHDARYVRTVNGTGPDGSGNVVVSGGGGGGGPLTGEGSPEAVVAAPVGTEYVDTARTTGALKWIKASGTGSTGWIVTVGHTGWRAMAHSVPLTSGDLRWELMRDRGTVRMLVAANSNSHDGFMGALPLGFRRARANPGGSVRMHDWSVFMIRGGTTGSVGAIRINPNNDVYLANANQTNGAAYLTWDTADPWPTSLPGVAVT